MDKETHLIVLSRYIHLNPVRARIVKNPDDYRWTSYREYIGGYKEKESIVDTTEILCNSSDGIGHFLKKVSIIMLFEFICRTITLEF